MSQHILITGAAGFIGTNLLLRLSADPENRITLTDEEESYFETVRSLPVTPPGIRVMPYTEDAAFDALLEGQDIVYHLASSTNPTTSNRDVAAELAKDVVTTARFLDTCIRQRIKRFVFISSGGTVYGEGAEKHREGDATDPINTYGVQKLTIEKLLHMYHHMQGLDYKIARLSNPYGPYQRPNGILGAVTSFIYRALQDEAVEMYGDGQIVRDYIYIDDAIRAVLNIASDESKDRVFNVGSGEGISINEIVTEISSVLQKEVNVIHLDARKVDVPVNVLDVGRYENRYGKIRRVMLQDGIRKTADFIMGQYLS